jgi:acetylornithine deacetylase/succinyl-diaminopimelate desuccinylase-like protein
MPTKVNDVLARLHAGEPAAISRLIEWLRIPSISTDPAYVGQTRDAAKWCADQLRASGFDAHVKPAHDAQGKPGHPIVFAHHPGDAEYQGPHVLFYGHYDVQPVDPVDLWESPPFEPARRGPKKGEPGGERIVARGAVDDKGQVAMFLEAMRAWKEVTGKTAGGVRMTLLIEGEEESGSVSLPTFVKDHAKDLKACDICVISDTGMLDRGKPAITYGVRGLAYTEVTLHGPSHDLHSGLWGGRMPNPATELVKVLAQLWDKDRRVTIDGFYDDVRALKPEERAAWAKLPIDDARNLAEIGMKPAADVGEAGYTATERVWARPTAEINGIIAGYTGPGAKTVIGSKASAKVSFRLVADQDPAKITKLFFAWLEKRTPPGCRWELNDHHGGFGVTVDIAHPCLKAASRAIERAAGVPPALIKSGGSIPVAGLLKSELGLETIFMGFGLDDDRVHSPNEKFELDCYRLGAKSHAILVDELWSMKE